MPFFRYKILLTDRDINVLRQDYMDPFIMTHTHTQMVTDPGFLKREVTDLDGNAQGDFFLKNDIKKKTIWPEGGWYTHVHPRTYHIKPKTDFK